MLHDGVCLSYRCKDGLRKGDYDFFAASMDQAKAHTTLIAANMDKKKMLAALLAANIYAKVYAATCSTASLTAEGAKGGYLFIYSVGVVPYALEKHLEK